jgi:hypothetical protein
MERNMTLSKDDALALLSRWKNEEAAIQVTILSPVGEFKFGGIVTDFSPIEFSMVSPPSLRPVFELSINISQAFDFDYSDSREAPPEIEAAATEIVRGLLHFKLPVASVGIFELEGEWD